MDSQTAQRLLQLNQEFYQTFAAPFAATRGRVQPGVRRLIGERIPLNGTVLDLGCGNGNLARALAAHGFQGRYLGLDASEGFLALARAGLPPDRFTFLHRDLAAPDWAADLPLPTFDCVVAFAVLHHLPGKALRRAVVKHVRDLLPPGGLFCHSHWMFLDSPRLRARVQPWERVGLRPDQVDAGDYLIDWRHGGEGLRYVHLCQEDELATLAAASGFRVLERFRSDGENGRLGLYHIWEAV